MDNRIKGYYIVHYSWGDMGGFSGQDSIIIKADSISQANKKYLEWVKEQNKLGTYPSTNDIGFNTRPLCFDVD